MFVGRESELKALTEFMNAAETKAATVYGRRRIGKTTLLRKAIVDAPGKTIFFEALDGRYETNLNLLASTTMVPCLEGKIEKGIQWYGCIVGASGKERCWKKMPEVTFNDEIVTIDGKKIALI